MQEIPSPLMQQLLIIHTPYLATGYLQFLAELNIPVEEILYEIVNILTPDGNEQAYYERFDTALASKGILAGTPKYTSTYHTASTMYVAVLDQIILNPFVDLIMSGWIKSYRQMGSSTYILMDYTPDFDQ